MKDKLLKYWLIQEMLLQAYRLLFGITQVVLFTGAAIIVSLSQRTEPLLAILPLALILLGLGVRITRARALDVSYFQWLIISAPKEMEGPDNILYEFKQWQRQPRSQKIRMLREGGILPSGSRSVFELWLPALFLAGWVAMGLIVLVY